MGKKILAIILTVLGSLVSLAGALFLFAWIDMAIGDGLQKSDMEAYLVLGAILIGGTVLAGILPLVAGIKMVRKQFPRKKSKWQNTLLH